LFVCLGEASLMRLLYGFYNLIFGGHKKKYQILYRLYYKYRNTKLGDYFHYVIESRYNLVLSKKAIIGNNLELVHPIGIVIGAHVVIGRNVKIFQNVTIGGARLGDAVNETMPKIGDECTIFSGAVIVGNVSIGRNCTIGANSVVTTDIPDNSVAVGSPARVIKTIPIQFEEAGLSS
jgi:serine O-acetyltransferase